MYLYKIIKRYRTYKISEQSKRKKNRPKEKKDEIVVNY